jgi:hypothetical protein
VLHEGLQVNEIAVMRDDRLQCCGQSSLARRALMISVCIGGIISGL